MLITSLDFAKSALALLLVIVACAIKDVSPINTLSDVRSFSVTTRDERLLLIVMLKVASPRAELNGTLTDAFRLLPL